MEIIIRADTESSSVVPELEGTVLHSYLRGGGDGFPF